MEKEIDKINDFDFGFSFHEPEEQKSDEYEIRLKKLHSAILPFLDNLCKDPDKETIRWPNRVQKIAEFKQKLQQIVEGK